MRTAAAGALLAVLASSAVAVAVARAGDRSAAELISRASGAKGAEANAPASFPSTSRSGRIVAYASEATNLAPEDTDKFFDVYVRMRSDDATVLVSVGDGVAGAKANADSGSPAVSADARFVAFGSAATNLTADLVPVGTGQIYVRDLAVGTTTLVSRASGAGGAPGDAASGDPEISADGRFVAFSSAAGNLDPSAAGNPARSEHVYVRDLATATTTLVSRTSGEAGVPARGNSISPRISADGTKVAFTSFAGNLDAADRSEGAASTCETWRPTRLRS